MKSRASEARGPESQNFSELSRDAAKVSKSSPGKRRGLPVTEGIARASAAPPSERHVVGNEGTPTTLKRSNEDQEVQRS